MKLCIATMMKNESDSLIEWVCYHLAIGIDSFIVANNESSDSTKDILKLLSDFCNLEFFDFETPKSSKPQLPAFNYMLNKYKHNHDLMAFIDADEFLCPMDEHEEIAPLLDNLFLHDDVGALAINWCNYGSSNAIFKEPGLAIERFSQHSLNNFLPNHHYKTIFRAKDAIRFINPHHIETNKKYISSDGSELINHPNLGIGLSKDVKWENIRINHYVIKSLQEYFVGKSLRGNASTQKPVDRKSYFLSYDRNEAKTLAKNAIIHNTYLKISELIAFSKIKLGSTPIYLQELESYFIANSFFHIDILNEKIISCWAINKLASKYELVICSENSENKLQPNFNRPDVVKAILGTKENYRDLCGFSYRIDREKIKTIKLTNGFIEHVIYEREHS